MRCARMRWRPQRLTMCSARRPDACCKACVSCSAASSSWPANASTRTRPSRSRRAGARASASASQQRVACASAGCALVPAHWRESIARLSCTRCVDRAATSAAARVSSLSRRCATTRTSRCDSMRSCPARFIASAHCAASMTERDTSPRRRFTFIAAPRSRPKASLSPSPRALISTPLARSTQRRSSSCAWARASARRNAPSWRWRA